MEQIEIRPARLGDEKRLAHIQTESWKAAFAEILSPEDLAKHTDIRRTEEMYRRVLHRGMIQVAIEFVEGQPHGIAAWGANRAGLGEKTAELICIHSLRARWGRGYGSAMMAHILSEMKDAGYSGVMLWVFEKNVRARGFYEKHGFRLTERTQNSFGAVEVMYKREL